ncbi:hypothetical protein IE077_002734 [Cardiosporidium cionae]|uniref:Helicase ATP-binding domain-containing protein n=1 Tax=Cardiosporidium cionae TaxID=476202 RepID=A0ABQ7JA32_9APIC|nr:hypothetical protein IE077_002734 [Cardiosporidium cionae]|eukprot:KAF8820862.1 hypothetical protein IE077_002734 [Cardiosporidium cionae]
MDSSEAIEAVVVPETLPTSSLEATEAVYASPTATSLPEVASLSVPDTEDRSLSADRATAVDAMDAATIQNKIDEEPLSHDRKKYNICLSEPPAASIAIGANEALSHSAISLGQEERISTLIQSSSHSVLIKNTSVAALSPKNEAVIPREAITEMPSSMEKESAQSSSLGSACLSSSSDRAFEVESLPPTTSMGKFDENTTSVVSLETIGEPTNDFSQTCVIEEGTLPPTEPVQKDSDNEMSEDILSEHDEAVATESPLPAIEVSSRNGFSGIDDKELEEKFRLLLEKTDFFSRKITGGITGKPHIGSKVGVDGASRMHLLTEKEEDDLLLMEAEEENESTAITHQPACITGTMKGYQVDGLSWLYQIYRLQINGILADEMGLGKTLQTISLLGFLLTEKNIGGPHLIICPRSTLENWKNEILRWCPLLRVSRLTHFAWKYLIMDEAHRIKNEKSILSEVVRMFKPQRRLLITGTPLQNNLKELWSLLNFLMPKVVV